MWVQLVPYRAAILIWRTKGPTLNGLSPQLFLLSSWHLGKFCPTFCLYEKLFQPFDVSTSTWGCYKSWWPQLIFPIHFSHFGEGLWPGQGLPMSIGRTMAGPTCWSKYNLLNARSTCSGVSQPAFPSTPDPVGKLLMFLNFSCLIYRWGYNAYFLRFLGRLNGI